MSQPPRYHFRSGPPSLWDVALRGVSDIASVIPASILSEPAVQLPGRGTPLVVSDPDLVREVLNDKDGRFTRYHTMRRLMRRSWGKGLAAADGEDWKRQRRAAAPAFTPSAVSGRIDVFAVAAGKCAATWPNGESVELTRRVAQVIADIIFTALVDGKGAVDTAAMAADMPAYINRISTFGTLDLLPLPESLHDRIRGIPGDPAVQRVRALARRLAEDRGLAKDRGGSGADDLVALMAGHGPIEDQHPRVVSGRDGYHRFRHQLGALCARTASRLAGARRRRGAGLRGHIHAGSIIAHPARCAGSAAALSACTAARARQRGGRRTGRLSLAKRAASSAVALRDAAPLRPLG